MDETVKNAELNWAAVRFACAALILVALVVQLQRTVSIAHANGREVATVVTNFFSFFTVLSNALSAVVLLATGAWLLRPSGAQPRALALGLASVSTYMIVTGVVYNALLRGVELPQGSTVGWSNEVLHVVGPLYLLIEVLFGPRGRRLGWSAIGVVLVFPIGWVTYTLFRGPHVTDPISGEKRWYPYPFLNPHITAGGGWGVAAYVAAISVLITAVAAAVVWQTRRRTIADARDPVADAFELLLPFGYSPSGTLVPEDEAVRIEGILSTLAGRSADDVTSSASVREHVIAELADLRGRNPGADLADAIDRSVALLKSLDGSPSASASRR